ncbi:cytochrome P450 [Phanerochaete sordida]|uniref:Cytochrome P450 n=1 Tax=Phanerochaete sordida TaxID=48140 RepID=A0A9P3LJZ9_9APHY|nr:cytochrome P450 [Phanerochaete sordida]
MKYGRPLISLYLNGSGFISIVIIFVVRRFRRHPSYPPGPKGWPIIGNVLDVPVDYGWEAYREMGRKYDSDIVHLEAFGSHIVVLNSAKAAGDLLGKRSNIYSDRQVTVMAHELTGWHRAVGFIPYGDYWRTHRRLFNQHFRAAAIPQYHYKQIKAVRRLLRSLLDSPEDFLDQIRFTSSAVLLDIVFAFDIKPGDYRIELVERAMAVANLIVDGGTQLVDLIPSLKHLPAWLPGAGFKRTAAEWKVHVDGMFNTPFDEFKATMGDEKAQECFTALVLSRRGKHEEHNEEIDQIARNLAGTAFAAGSDTSVATLTIFIYALIQFPHAQAAAQAELDSVLGQRRLPEISDKDQLPHVTAIVLEVLRWRPAIPLGIPHRLTVDDEYNGYHIPAGSIVMGNAWAMLHDEAVYPDPEEFKPERYLNDDGSLRADMPYPAETFGHGRRICAGRHFAHDILWLAIAHILTVFKVERPLNDGGQEVTPEVEFTPRFISVPKPFKCRFTPRFSGAEALINISSIATQD